MEKAKVLVAMKPNEIDLIEQEVPAPGPTELQIRAHRSLLSHGTERAYILRLPGTEWVKFPCYPGYASAGEIVAVGKEVTRFKVGDRVSSMMSHRSLGNVDQERLVFKLPTNVSFDDATFMTLGATALQGVRKAQIEVGEAVAVLGLGIVGQLAARFARLNGALPVIGLERLKKRMALSLKGGADLGIDTNEGRPWKEELKAATDGKGPQVIIESSGFPEVIDDALDVVRHSGRVVLLGSPRGTSVIDTYNHIHGKQVTLIGAHCNENPKVESRPGFWTRQDEFRTVLGLMDTKRLDVSPLITERFAVDKVLACYHDMLERKGDWMGTLIEWVR